MAERGDTHYNLKRMNRVFLVTSVILLGTAIWMVMDDWSRAWKGHQRDFQELELERAEARLAEIATPEWTAEKDRLEGEIDRIQSELEGSEPYQEAMAEWKEAEAERYRTEADFKIAKAVWNWEKFLSNQAQAGGDQETIDAQLASFQKAEEDVEAARVASEQATAAQVAATARLGELTADRTELETQLAGLQIESGLVEKKILDLSPGVFKSLRDAPGLDFVAPSLKVRKQVLPHLRKNYNFLTVPRVDMCATCHVGIDNSAYVDADVEQPLKGHPRLDLFLAPGSPHPVEKFGCTVCHEGAGETLDFNLAVHMPSNDEERKKWEEDHHWHLYHYWDWPMIPTEFTEASCYSCHSRSGTLELISEDAPKLTKGLQLAEQYGCYSCHNIKGWRIDRKSGPNLRTINQKINADFARAWIKNPHAYRESTWMPQVFHLENSVSPEWDDTAIAAIQTYLWRKSEDADIEGMPAAVKDAADAEEGEALFKQVGCTACHNAPGSAAHDYSEFGPDLAGIGSKLSEDWLYEWIMDPAAWWPDTRMPNLRLEPEQAGHIARYLTTLKKDGWEESESDAPQVDPVQLELQAKTFLQRRYTVEESEKVYEEWQSEGTDKVLEEVGQRWISRQGCYSCHDIPGFEAGMPIGADLSNWGNKILHQLAFERWDEHVPGHFEGAVQPSRHAFAQLKLSNPRRFDRGLEVPVMDRLRMPDFKLAPDEIEALTTVVLGLKDTENTILPEALQQVDEEKHALDRGAFLVRRNNCYGCHKFEMDTMNALVEGDDGPEPRSFHGLVTLEDDEDEYATFFQLWKTAPDTVAEGEGEGLAGTNAMVYWDMNDDEPWPVQAGKGGGIMPGLAEYYVDAGEVDSDVEAFPLLPPILYREGEKVRAPWLTQFLLAPYTLRPWLDVKMPTFPLTEEDSRSIALYFAALARKEWPSRYARDLRASQEMTIQDMADATGVTVEQLRGIESGGRFNTNAFTKVLEWGNNEGFLYDPMPELPFEQVLERSPAYLAAKEAHTAQYLRKGSELVGPNGVNCYSCHIRDGKTPGGDKLSWGPDLAYSKDRLRPDWVRQWVIDAQKIYPGTKMPTAIDFLKDQKLQEILEGSPEELVEAVKDFLMNSDRVPEPVATND